jgi:hypothetical protein
MQQIFMGNRYIIIVDKGIVKNFDSNETANKLFQKLLLKQKQRNKNGILFSGRRVTVFYPRPRSEEIFAKVCLRFLWLLF